MECLVEEGKGGPGKAAIMSHAGSRPRVGAGPPCRNQIKPSCANGQPYANNVLATSAINQILLVVEFSYPLTCQCSSTQCT